MLAMFAAELAASQAVEYSVGHVVNWFSTAARVEVEAAESESLGFAAYSTLHYV